MYVGKIMILHPWMFIYIYINICTLMFCTHMFSSNTQGPSLLVCNKIYFH